MQTATEPRKAEPAAVAVFGGMPLAAAAAVVGYAAVLFAPPVLNDGDTYWHIATGEWMLRNGAVPNADPFSYSVPGTHWVTLEWLSELLMGIAYRLGEWNGIVVLFGMAAALSAGLLAGFLERWVDRLPALLLLLVGTVCVAPSLLARPHLLALPPLILWTAGLIEARRRAQAPSLLLVPLMTVWANLHGSFVFGLAIAVPFALEAVAEPGGRRRAAVTGWGSFVAAAIVAAVITPHGWEGLVFPFHLMNMRYMAQIYEWQPPDFSTLQPIELALMVLLYVALTRPVRVPVLRVFILMGLLHLALQHGRQQLLAGIVGTLIVADALRAGQPMALRRQLLAWRAAGALMLILTGIRMADPIVRTDNATSPVSAVAHVPAELARTHVFNDYGFGGYLIFKGIRPFVDGRADMYGDAFLAADLAAMADPEKFKKIVDQYDVKWTLLYANSAAAAMVSTVPGWHVLYSDRIATVQVRDD